LGPREASDPKELPQYSSQAAFDKAVADRRHKVLGARTYFYLNEATCERNMETFIRCLEAVKYSSFGTGITAIKLTALGRPNLLLQMSDVIQKTRQYMIEIAGGTGNVLTHHKTIKDLEQYFGGMGQKKEVKEFLKKVTTDKEG
jgi:proline dehydrogenase